MVRKDVAFVDTNQYYWVNKTGIRVQRIKGSERIKPFNSIVSSPSKAGMMLLSVLDAIILSILIILLNIIFLDVKQIFRNKYIKPLILGTTH